VQVPCGGPHIHNINSNQTPKKLSEVYIVCKVEEVNVKSNKPLLCEMEGKFCSVFMLILSEFLVFIQSQMRETKNVFRNYVYSKLDRKFTLLLRGENYLIP
jgi:hypothetical protein